MWKLAAALLFTPALVMVGAPSKRPQSASVTQDNGLKQASHLVQPNMQQPKFTVGTSANAAVYPMVSAQTFAMISAH